MMGSFEKRHVQTGRDPIRIPGEQDISENPELWETLWNEHRTALLADWINQNPGSRPEAWWQFDTDDLPAQDEDESEIEYLYRTSQLGESEIAGIIDNARSLVAYNRGRDPRNPNSNFVKDERGHIEFCLNHELLTEAEAPEVF